MKHPDFSILPEKTRADGPLQNFLLAAGLTLGIITCLLAAIYLTPEQTR